MHNQPHGPDLPACPQCDAEIARDVATFDRECVGVTHNNMGFLLSEWCAAGYAKDRWLACDVTHASAA